MKFNVRLKLQIKSRPLVSLTLAFFLVIGVWSQLTPLFAAPDEPAGYIRGAALVRGELVGTDIAASQTTAYWSTYVDIPQQFGVAQLVPWCFVGKPETPACSLPLETLTPVEQPRTDMGRYPPVGYLASGLGSLVGATDLSVRLGRLINATICAFLIALGCVNILSNRRSIIVVLAAVTPGVIFFSSVISSSAIEISAAICFWCSITTLMSSTKISFLIFNSVAISSSLLTLARPIGVVNVTIIVGISLIAHANLKESIARIISSWRIILATIISLIATVAWYLKIYSYHLGERVVTDPSNPMFRQIVEQSLNDTSTKIGESIGNFGWLDTPTPVFVVWFFVALFAVIIAQNWNQVTKANRNAVVCLALLIPFLMIFINRNTQNLLRTYGVQGRYLTPLIAGIPIIIGAVWVPRKKSAGLIVCGWAVAVFATAINVLRRYSVGIKPQNFFEMFSNPVWQPPLGVLGTMLALAAALTVFGSVFYTIATSDFENNR
jgi:Predicted membrane protein (DUF2142)